MDCDQGVLITAHRSLRAELKSKIERRSRLLRISVNRGRCSPSAIARSLRARLGAEPLAMDACLRASGANARLPSRRARLRWRHSRKAGGGSNAVEADERGGSNERLAPLNVKTVRS